MTAIPINLTSVDMRAAGVHGWTVRKNAAALLARLREHGRNADRCVEIHPANNRFFHFWVIARPDPLSEFTWLMDRDGTWARGRLTDQYDKPAVWTPHPTPERIPATITHDYRYSCGSTGVTGHDGKPLMTDGLLGYRPTEVLTWMASAFCVACTWSTHDDREETVRASARHHRTNPGNYPLRPFTAVQKAETEAVR